MQYGVFFLKDQNLTEFEKARSYYKNLFLTTIECRDKPVFTFEKRGKIKNGFICYRDVLKDLYISGLEDLKDNRDLWLQEEEFGEWYDSQSRETIEYLIDKLILQEGCILNSRLEAEEIRDKYMFPDRRVEVLYSSRRRVKGRLHKEHKPHEYLKKEYPKTFYEWEFPDGSIRVLTGQTASRNFIRKGIPLIRRGKVTP